MDVFVFASGRGRENSLPGAVWRRGWLDIIIVVVCRTREMNKRGRRFGIVIQLSAFGLRPVSLSLWLCSLLFL